MSSTTPYTMSPTLSSAGGLNARTRATRFSESRTRTPGVAAKTSPFRSYVPSPGSNSSATAISSQGRTIFASIWCSDSFGSDGVGRRYLSLRHFESVEDDVNPPNLFPVEVEGVRNRKGVRQPVGDHPGAGLDAPTDVRFRPRVQERVDDVAPRERGVEERSIRMPTLRTERWIHENRLEALADRSDVCEAPLDVDPRAFPVPACDFDRRPIGVQTHHPTGAEKLRGNREHAVPAPEVRRRTALDIAPRRSDIRDLGGDAGGRPRLLPGPRPRGPRGPGLQELLEAGFLLPLAPPRDV